MCSRCNTSNISPNPRRQTLQFPDEFVRKHAATLVREVAKHTPELAQLVVANGGVGALVEYAADSAGNNALPAIMALGYIAAFSETLALAVIAEKVGPLFWVVSCCPVGDLRLWDWIGFGCSL